MAVTNSGVVVPSDVLLMGSLWALQQCGLLLLDADLLFQQSRYSTAAGVALLGHEELGRCEILTRLWKTSDTGTIVTRDEVVAACTDHVDKQVAGQLASTFRADTESEYTKLLRARGKAMGTPKFQALDEKVKAIDRQRARRQPQDRHAMRMKCFYVDPLENAAGWSKPSDVSPAKCAKALAEAINDYSLVKSNMENPALTGDDALVEALAALTDKPDLPQAPLMSGAFTFELF